MASEKIKKIILKGKLKVSENEGGYTSPSIIIGDYDLAYYMQCELAPGEHDGWDWGNQSSDIPGIWEIIVRRIDKDLSPIDIRKEKKDRDEKYYGE